MVAEKIIDKMNRPPKILTADEIYQRVKENVVDLMACKLYSVLNLAWDYALSVCDIAAQMKRDDCKPITRKIRAAHTEYEKHRATAYTAELSRNEEERGLVVEANIKDIMREYKYGIDLELSRNKIKDDNKIYLMGLYEALILATAASKYSEYVDNEIGKAIEQHIPDILLLNGCRDMMRLLPQMSGATHKPKADLINGAVNRIMSIIHKMEVIVREYDTER